MLCCEKVDLEAHQRNHGHYFLWTICMRWTAPFAKGVLHLDNVTESCCNPFTHTSAQQEPATESLLTVFH